MSRAESQGAPQIVAESPAMQRVRQQLARLARSEVPVLILGETGSGKEVVARAIHAESARAAAPLGTVNCGALPDQLVESTLFGYERGAFTGAEGRREGVFEATHGGTVLLDEIGEMPLSAQAVLLRVLETRSLVRVGGTRELPIDVRVLAATNRDLEEMCAAGSFRRDLYYRLNVLSLSLPPLRHRHGDVRPLAELLLGQACARNKVELEGFSEAALARLEAYSWPGNVRELRNVIERAVVMVEGSQIGVEELPDRLVPERASAAPAPSLIHGGPPEAPVEQEAPVGFKAQMRRHEVEVIIRALEQTEQNQTEAAKLLQMPLRTLVHKIKLHDIRRILRDRQALRLDLPPLILISFT